MTAAVNRGRPLHPLHAILLAFLVSLFTCALIADVAYLRSAEIQWSNFAAWLIVGGLVFGGFFGLWALIDLALSFRHGRPTRKLVYVICLAVAWVLGLINAFHHSRDVWSSVGTGGLILSVLSTALALVGAWFAYSSSNVREIAR
nr:DUF2231 domain-containing protein [uncultured Brevundimonas sp.]